MSKLCGMCIEMLSQSLLKWGELVPSLLLIRSKPVTFSHLLCIRCVQFLLSEVNVVVFVSVPGEFWVFAVFAQYVKASFLK